MKNSHNSSNENAPEISRQVFNEQIHALYKHLLVILFINLIVGCMLIYGLWNVVSQQALVIWGVGLLASIMLRIILYIMYRRTDPRNIGQRQATYFSLGNSRGATFSRGSAGIPTVYTICIGWYGCGCCYFFDSIHANFLCLHHSFHATHLH